MRSRAHLSTAIFDALLRLLPAYKRAIDGHIIAEKQKAWREIVEKLRLDQELRRKLGEQAEFVLANLDPTVLNKRFLFLKHNAHTALKSYRNQGSVNPLHQKILQFYPINREKSRRMNTV
jgi:hypothetical protein